MNAKTVSERILQIIGNSPECRTDKRKLVANFLHSEVKDMNLNSTSLNYFDFLKMYALGKFTEIETITRIHREVIRELDRVDGKDHDLKEDEQKKVKSDLKNLYF
jgi:hypothetical protein